MGNTMATNRIIECILEKEGGYINNSDDSGGPTCWGITEKVARDFGYSGLMLNLPREYAYDILEKMYWYQPGFDKIDVLSSALAMELCDTGTNMGTSVCIKWLQRWLNAYNNAGDFYPETAIDGKIGPGTLNALNAFLNRRGKEGENVMLISLNCSQGHRYLELTEDHKKNKTFIYGWIKERVHT